MIVSIFKKNLFFNSLLLLPFTVLLRIYSLIYPNNLKSFEEGGILYNFFIDLIPNNHITYSIISIFVVFFEAVLINRLAIKNRFSRELTLLPGMVFIILTSLSPKFQVLTPINFGLIFIIISFINLFKTYKKYNSERFLFNTGFFLGIAILFYFNFIFLLLPIVIGLLSIRAFKIAEILQLLSGLLMVIYFYVFWMYLHDYSIKTPEINLHSIRNLQTKDVFQLVVYLFYLLLIIGTVLTYRKFVIKKSIQSQKKINIIFGLLIFAIISIVFNSQEFYFSYFYVIAFPLSYFTAMILLRIKNNLILEIVNLIVIFEMMVYHFQFFS